MLFIWISSRMQFLTDCCSSSPWCYLASCITIYLLSPSFDFSIKHSFYKLSTLFHFLFFPHFCQLFSCSTLLEPLYVFLFKYDPSSDIFYHEIWPVFRFLFPWNTTSSYLGFREILPILHILFPWNMTYSLNFCFHKIWPKRYPFQEIDFLHASHYFLQRGHLTNLLQTISLIQCWLAGQENGSLAPHRRYARMSNKRNLRPCLLYKIT